MQTIFKITEQWKVRKFLFGKIFKLSDLTNSTFQLKLLVTKSIWYAAYFIWHTVCGIPCIIYLIWKITLEIMTAAILDQTVTNNVRGVCPDDFNVQMCGFLHIFHSYYFMAEQIKKVVALYNTFYFWKPVLFFESCTFSCIFRPLRCVN